MFASEEMNAQAEGGGSAIVRDENVAKEMFDSIMRGELWAANLRRMRNTACFLKIPPQFAAG